MRKVVMTIADTNERIRRDCCRRATISRTRDQDARPTIIQSSPRIADVESRRIRLMMISARLASTECPRRIATLSIAHDGSNRAYPFIGVSDGHHDLSHHGGNEEKKSENREDQHFHMRQFAYFVEKLRSIKEGNGTLLDQSMIVYGSGLADGNAHDHSNLPVLLAGHGRWRHQPGRHLQVPKETPMTTSSSPSSTIWAQSPARGRQHRLVEGTFLKRMKLRLIIERDPETGRYSAVYPELPGCASAGDTEDEAI